MRSLIDAFAFLLIPRGPENLSRPALTLGAEITVHAQVGNEGTGQARAETDSGWPVEVLLLARAPPKKKRDTALLGAHRHAIARDGSRRRCHPSVDSSLRPGVK